jgi:hypothetical protein
MKDENSGSDANGRDFSPGWNCTPMNEFLEFDYLAAAAVGDRPVAIQAASGYHFWLLLIR